MGFNFVSSIPAEMGSLILTYNTIDYISNLIENLKLKRRVRGERDIKRKVEDR